MSIYSKIISAGGRYTMAFLLATSFTIISPHSFASKDFAWLRDQIQTSTQLVYDIEDEAGRFDNELLEPLQQLARFQIEANLFSDADQTLDRAIQIARFNDGLYTHLQYPLLKLSVVNSQFRRDWSATVERLDRFSLLVANNFDGNGKGEEQLSLLKWMADKHLQCALETNSEHYVTHISKATIINEYAVQLAQFNRQTDDPVYGELLHSLAHNYYIESRGIIAGGENSYKLRVLPNGSGMVESKAAALDRRYALGLDKLRMLRKFAADSTENRLEAIAMAEIYIADWNIIFDSSEDIDYEYGRAMNKLMAAGVPEEKVHDFFATPVVLPRPEFTLDFGAAASRIEATVASNLDLGFNSAADEQDSSLYIIESNEKLPGMVRHGSSSNVIDADNWSSVLLSFAIDPLRKKRSWFHGFSERSAFTPSDIEIRDAQNAPEKTLKAALSRIKKMVFRPAFQQGKLVPTTFTARYNFRDSEAVSDLLAATGLDFLAGD